MCQAGHETLIYMYLSHSVCILVCIIYELHNKSHGGVDDEIAYSEVKASVPRASKKLGE